MALAAPAPESITPPTHQQPRLSAFTAPSQSPLQRIFAGSRAPSSTTTPRVAHPSASEPHTPSPCHPIAASADTPLPSSVECCVWCLLGRLAVVPLSEPLSRHLPPQWSSATQVKQWKRRVDMTQQPLQDTSSTQPQSTESGHLCRHCSKRQPQPRPYAGEHDREESAGRRDPRLAVPSTAASGMDRVSVLHGFLSTRAIPSLLGQTNYSRHELYSIFLRFKSLCCLSASGPDGIDAATFQRGVVRLSVEDSRFVSRVFALVDADNSGSIEWEEFLVAMAALEKGSAEIKAKFACQVYDLDGDGFIGRQDLVFDTFGCGSLGLISFDAVLHHIKAVNPDVDVWDLFGRSMLKETRRNQPAVSGKHQLVNARHTET